MQITVSQAFDIAAAIAAAAQKAQAAGDPYVKLEAAQADALRALAELDAAIGRAEQENQKESR